MMTVSVDYHHILDDYDIRFSGCLGNSITGNAPVTFAYSNLCAIWIDAEGGNPVALPQGGDDFAIKGVAGDIPDIIGGDQ